MIYYILVLMTLCIFSAPELPGRAARPGSSSPQIRVASAWLRGTIVHYIYIYMYMYIHIYIYIYLYTYIYIYII